MTTSTTLHLRGDLTKSRAHIQANGGPGHGFRCLTIVDRDGHEVRVFLDDQTAPLLAVAAVQLARLREVSP